MGADSGWEDEKEMDHVLRELSINMKIINIKGIMGFRPEDRGKQNAVGV